MLVDITIESMPERFIYDNAILVQVMVWWETCETVSALIITCVNHKKNPTRTADNIGQKDKMGNILAVILPTVDIESIGQSQNSLRAKHPLMLLIVCATYENNPFITAEVTEWVLLYVHHYSLQGHD